MRRRGDEEVPREEVALKAAEDNPADGMPGLLDQAGERHDQGQSLVARPAGCPRLPGRWSERRKHWAPPGAHALKGLPVKRRPQLEREP